MRAARSTRTVSPALLAATTETLLRLGPRQFSLTAVAEAAGVSRGTVHNALGSRDHAIKTALDHLASMFTEKMAAEVDKESTLADQVAAAAVAPTSWCGWPAMRRHSCRPPRLRRTRAI